jgi:hypothetical protein
MVEVRERSYQVSVAASIWARSPRSVAAEIVNALLEASPSPA